MQFLRLPGASGLPSSTLWQLCKPWATEREVGVSPVGLVRAFAVWVAMA